LLRNDGGKALRGTRPCIALPPAEGWNIEGRFSC